MGLLTNLLTNGIQPLAPTKFSIAKERHNRELSSLIVGVSAASEHEAVAVYLRSSGTLHAWRYPDDPFLPALAAVTGAGFFRRWHWERPWPAEQAHGRPANIQRLAYHPGRRAVFLLGWPGTAEQLVLKLLRPDLFAQSLACALAVEASGLASRVAIPRLVSYAPELHALLYEYIPGSPIRQLDLADTAALAAEAAEALAAIHRAPAQDLTPWNVARELRRSRAMLDDLARWLPDAAAELLPALDQIGTRLAQAGGGGIRLCHGDFSARNVLYRAAGYAPCGGGLAVVDWDSATLGPPERDLAAFLAVLRRFEQSQELFLSAYSRQVGYSPDLGLVDAFRQYQRWLKLCRRAFCDGQSPTPQMSPAAAQERWLRAGAT